MNKIRFSNIEITPYDIWFLEGTKYFNDRKLMLGKTPKGKTVVSLVETRMTDLKVFIDTQSGFKAEKIIKNEKNRVLYTRQEVLLSRKGEPYGWIYGVNVQIRNKKGVVSQLRQYSSDFHGNRTLVKKIMS